MEAVARARDSPPVQSGAVSMFAGTVPMNIVGKEALILHRRMLLQPKQAVSARQAYKLQQPCCRVHRKQQLPAGMWRAIRAKIQVAVMSLSRKLRLNVIISQPALEYHSDCNQPDWSTILIAINLIGVPF